MCLSQLREHTFIQFEMKLINYIVIAPKRLPALQIVPFDMKGCICHLAKWQMHLFVSTGISMGVYGAHFHREHCTLHSFEQFGALYMHNHDVKYPARPGFEPGTSRLQAPFDTYEPSGPACHLIN